MLLDAFKQADGIVERFAVGCGTGILAKSIDGETYGVELLLCVFRASEAVE